MEAHHIRAILLRHRLNRYIPRWLTTAVAMALSIVIFIRRLKLDFYSRCNAAFEWISSYEWYWSTYTDIMTATVSFFNGVCNSLRDEGTTTRRIGDDAYLHVCDGRCRTWNLTTRINWKICCDDICREDVFSGMVSIHQFGIAAIDATYSNLGMERPWKFTTMPVAVLVFLVHIKVVRVILHPPFCHSYIRCNVVEMMWLNYSRRSRRSKLVAELSSLNVFPVSYSGAAQVKVLCCTRHVPHAPHWCVQHTRCGAHGKCAARTNEVRAARCRGGRGSTAGAAQSDC